MHGTRYTHKDLNRRNNTTGMTSNAHSPAVMPNMKLQVTHTTVVALILHAMSYVSGFNEVNS